MKGVLVAAWSLSIILSGCLSSDEPTPEPPAPIKAKLVGYTLECPDLATDDDCTTTIPIPTENHLAGLGIAQNQHDPQHLMLYVKEAANAAFGVGRLVPNRLTGVPPEVWIVSSTDGGQSWHEAHPLLDPWAEPSKPNHPIQYHDLHLPAIFSGANGTWTTILGKTWYGSQED